MTTTVASAQVQLTPSVTGFAQRLRSELRQAESSIGDLSVSVVPKIDQSAYRSVTRDLDRLTRPRTVRFTADADTRAAADDLAVLARDRRTTVVADADTRAAAEELALLTRDRAVTVTAHVSGVSEAASAAQGAGGIMGALVSLAPALVPVAAYLGSIALQGGAAALAVGAFGAAVAPQISRFKDLSDAEDKAAKATSKYGATSKQATAAQQAVADTLNAMPAATRTAAGAFLHLKSDFQGWSDGLAKFTMVPVEHGIEVVDALLPKLSPLVKDTSAQFNRLITLLAGGVNSGAFDGIISRFTTFTNGVLKHGVDDVVHFARVLSQGSGNGPISQFMAYAKEQGPAVRQTLLDISRAVLQILKGASQAGPGILTLVDDVAKLVAALPPGFIARAMQVYTAFKLISLTRSGFASVAGAVTTLSGRLVALRAASAAAGGGIAGVRAALASLSTGAKVAGAVAVVAAVVVGLSALSKIGQKAPPDLDKMSAAIGNLGLKGQAAGELTKTFGADLEGLSYAVDRVAGKSHGMDKVNDVLNKVFTLGHSQSNSMKQAKKDIDAVDKSLAGLVQSGHADLAAAALNKLEAAYAKQGGKPKMLAKEMDDYKSALADAQFQAQLTAQSQGLFGSQAQAVSKQLDAQKASADGLRQSLQALNDVNRSALDGMVGFEAAIDAATQAAKANGKALSMKNGQLQLGTEKARNEASALSDLAAKTDAAAAAARDNGQSWSQVNAIYTEGRSKLIASAEAMGLTRKQAQDLAAQILKTPDKTALLKGDLSDLKAKLAEAENRLKTAPSSKVASIKGDIADLKQKIADAQASIDGVHGKTVAVNIVTTHSSSGTVAHEGGNYATGGVLPGYTPGQDVHHFYSPTAGRLNLSGGEAIMRPEWTRAVGPAFVHAMNALSRTRGIAGVRAAMGFRDGGILGPVQNFTKGGVVSLKSAQSSYDSALARVEADQTAVNQAQAAYNRAHSQADKIRAEATLRDARLRLKEARQAEAAAAKRLNEAQKRSSTYAAAVKKRNSAVQNVLDKLANNFVKGMTGTASTITSTANTVITSLQRLRDNALTANGRKAAIDTINLVRTDTAKLTSLAAKRDSVKATIAAANSYATNATDSAEQYASLTGLPSAGNTFDAKGILSGLNARLGQIKKFASNLALLAKRGLSKTLLNQLVQAGPEAGAAYAQALADASASELKSINSAQSQIDKAATSYGRSVADSMYDSGKQAGRGFLSGLQAQEAAIENEMSVLARKIQDAIKKALKIRSPSKVTEELGEFTGQGYLVGLENMHPQVAASAQRMADLVASVNPGSVHIERAPAAPGQAQTNNYFDLHTTDMPTEEGILLALRKNAVLRRPALL